MTRSRGLAAALLAWIVLSAAPSLAEVPSKYEVLRGDTLFAIARKLRYEGTSRNQMVLAIWRANSGAFLGGNINLLEIGTVLQVPPRDAVAAIAPGEADREVRDLLASMPTPAHGAHSVGGALHRPNENVGASALMDAAIRRYQAGLEFERKGNDQAALGAFLASGEAGYGLAQRKLGQIYDKGNSAVQRDLQTSILWYQRARAQGVAIDKPVSRTLPDQK